MSQIFGIIMLGLLLQSCASTDNLKGPTGKKQSANSIEMLQMLDHARGLMIVGKDREKKEVREFFLLGGKRLVATPVGDQQKWVRPRNPEDYVQLDNARMIERILRVPFGFASEKFRPTPDQQAYIRLLIAASDRVKITGIVLCGKCTPADSLMARRRADATKRRFISLGMDPSDISVGFQAGGEFMTDKKGNEMPRLVLIEFSQDFKSAT